MPFNSENNKIPKIIWILWLQGWSKAPNIVKISLKSWKKNNPDFIVINLDLINLVNFISLESYNRIISNEKEYEALSDEIRLELLTQQGGVWVDATTICAKPLSLWLSDHLEQGFFAFDKPSTNRMISTWFIAAEKNNYLVRQWRDSSIKYWTNRKKRDNYFWVHNLFAEIYESDCQFKLLWDDVRKISAAHDFHFGPEDQRLINSPSIDYLKGLLTPKVPVFKLTHKLSAKLSIVSLAKLIYMNTQQILFYKYLLKLLILGINIKNYINSIRFIKNI